MLHGGPSIPRAWCLIAGLGLIWLTSCTSPRVPEYEPEQITAALALLAPTPRDLSWSEWVVRCARDSGFKGRLSVDPLGSVSSSADDPQDDAVLERCLREADQLYAWPEIADRQLMHAAYYELQVRVAACLQTELGLDADLPSRADYVASDGNWNAYDAADPVDEAQWIRWNQTCPQDIWHYYDRQPG